MELDEVLEMGSSFSHSCQASQVPHGESEACTTVSSLLDDTLLLHASSSEEAEAMSIGPAEIVEPPPQSPAYEELLEVVTRSIAKLDLQCLPEGQ